MNKNKNTPKLLLTLAALLLTSPGAGGAPSFDCAKAGSGIERAICRPENQTLQQADSELARLYRELRQRLEEPQRSWLQESQRDWLRWRNWSCGRFDTPYLEECLLAEYLERNSEFKLGIISRPILADKLPATVAIPGLLDGEFSLSTQRGSETATERKLLFDGPAGRQVLWSGVSVLEDGVGDEHLLESLVISVADGNRVVLKAVHGRNEHNGGYDNPSEVRAAYFVLNGKKGFAAQGETGAGSASWGFETKYRHSWLRDSDGLRLQVAAQDWAFGDSSYLRDNQRHFLYRLRFDGRPWEELRPEIQAWVDKPDGAARFLAFYQETVESLDAGSSGDAAAPGRCVNEDIDFASAARGLGQWLDIVRTAQTRGVPYTQGPAIVALLLAAPERPVLSADQRALLAALDYHRRRIEATPGWQRRLTELQKRRGLTPVIRADENPYLADDMVAHGFPQLDLPCVEESRVPGYEVILPRHWFYTFWWRRHADGTYDLAKRAIEYALSAEGKAPKSTER